MARYHISSNGTPAVCHAEKGNCPLGGADGMQNHFDTKEEAQAAVDEQNMASFSVGENNVDGNANLHVEGDVNAANEIINHRFSSSTRSQAKLLHVLADNNDKVEHGDVTLDKLSKVKFDSPASMESDKVQENSDYIRGLYDQIKPLSKTKMTSQRITRERAVMPRVVTLQDVKDYQNANQFDKQSPITVYHMAKNFAEKTEGLSSAEIDKINANEGLVAHFAKANNMTPKSMELGSTAGRTYLKKKLGIDFPRDSMQMSQSVVFSEYGAKILPEDYDKEKVEKALSYWQDDNDETHQYNGRHLAHMKWQASSSELRKILGL